MTTNDVKLRIAPSPTGKFHLGTARTALFNFLFARRHKGSFVVRIEDTDLSRSEEQYTKDILDGMRWLGLSWDEGPEIGGEMGPYFQSERLDIYKKHISKLLDENKAYKCFCTTEELEAERKGQQASGRPPKYSGKCRSLTKEEIEKYEKEGRSFAVRFIVEPQKIVVEDIIRGSVEFDTGLIGDFPIARRDGMPLFVLTNTVDDNAMGITHVLRGEEHLSNAAKQLLLCKALNFLEPEFAHLPLIFNADKTKMSKRKNPVSVTDDYRAKGYLSEALVNFLVLLGWSSGNDREIYSMDELIKEFQLERVGKSASIFDPEKLLWMNGYYIRSLKLGDLAVRCKEFIKDKDILSLAESDPEYFLQTINLIQERLKLLSETEELISFFYKKPEYKAELLVARRSDIDRTREALKAAEKTIENIKNVTVDESEVALRRACQESDIKPGDMLWSVRVALSGKDASPGVFELIEVLGKEESLQRVRAAIKLLS